MGVLLGRLPGGRTIGWEGVDREGWFRKRSEGLRLGPGFWGEGTAEVARGPPEMASHASPVGVPPLHPPAYEVTEATGCPQPFYRSSPLV